MPGHEADLAGADADVAGRNVQVGADVAEQLGHEGLAETHDLAGAPALGVEVGAALAAAHRQRGQGVLEGLLEGQELQDREIDRGMEAQPALVGADRRAVLDAVAAVDLDLAAVVHPGHPEDDDPLRLHQAVEQAVLGVAGVLLDVGPQALHHFGDGLQEFGLGGIARLGAVQEFFQRLVFHAWAPFGLGQGAAILERKRRGVCAICPQDRRESSGPGIVLIGHRLEEGPMAFGNWQRRLYLWYLGLPSPPTASDSGHR